MNGLIDVHTHILPHMDDGAKDVQTSIEMLRAESAQGVAKVVLTPHYYPLQEDIAHFLTRRQQAYAKLLSALEKLSEQQRQQLPKLLLGAEVAWSPSLLERDVRLLCIGATRSLLLELPLDGWDQKMINQIYDLQMRQGILPIFAHFDRYLFPENKEYIEQLYDMRLPIQLGTEPFMEFFSRRKAMSMIRHGHGHLIASDCHNLDTRKPNLAKAMRYVEKNMGATVAQNLSRSAHNLVEE